MDSSAVGIGNRMSLRVPAQDAKWASMVRHSPYR